MTLRFTYPRAMVIALACGFASGCGNVKMDSAMMDPGRRVVAFLNDGVSRGDLPGIQYMVVTADSVRFAYAGRAARCALRPRQTAI